MTTQTALAIVPTPATPTLADLTKALRPYTKTSRDFVQFTGKDEDTWADLANFEATALSTNALPAREFDVAGLPTRFILTEDYALELARIRSLRISALTPNLGPLGEALGLGVQSPQVTLAQEAYRNRLLPEELAAVIKDMPIPEFFVEALLLDWANPRDKWLRKAYKSDTFTSAMEISRTGQLRLFLTEMNEYLRQNISHEWSHRLAHDMSEEEWQLFSNAVSLEWAFFVPNNYALTSFEEHFAVMGEELIHVDRARFETMANKGPLRTMAWMAALEKRLKALPEDKRGSTYAELMERCKYTREVTALKAKEFLAKAAALQKSLFGGV